MTVLQIRDELVNRLTQSATGQRWQQLPSRDRAALLILGFILMLLLIYAFVWLPINRKLDSAKSHYEQEYDFFNYILERAPNVVSSTRLISKALNSDQIQGVITNTAQQHGLALQRLENEGSGRLLVTIVQAPFDKVVYWLQALEGDGIIIFEIGLERTGEGKVDARINLGF